MSGLYVGHFSNTRYDTGVYPEELYESTAPYEYVMNPERIHNCNGCLTVFGPRSSRNGAGVSTPRGDVVAAAQEYVDIDSVLSNRNMPISKLKRGRVNPIDVTKIKTQNLPICNDYLDAQNTRMSDPAMYYRGAPINRFFDPIKDPQANIYYDWGINSVLEAKDNFVPDLPVPLPEESKIQNTQWRPCSVPIKGNGNCGTKCTNGRNGRNGRM